MDRPISMTVVVALAICGLGADAPPPAGPLSSVIIHPRPSFFPGWQTEPRANSAQFDLELGDSVEKTVIEIVPRRDDSRELAVQYQLETSLTIMNEGPHFDLVDWKHGLSAWTDLERIDEMRFRMPAIDYGAVTASGFPDYTVDELVEAVRALAGDRWAALAREQPDPDDGHVGFGISTVRIRVRAYDPAPAGWTTVFTIEVGVPMGC